MSADEINERQAASIDKRLNALLIETHAHESLIYGGGGVSAAQGLRHLNNVGALLEGLLGVTSLDRYQDVLDALDDALIAAPPAPATP